MTRGRIYFEDARVKLLRALEAEYLNAYVRRRLNKALKLYSHPVNDSERDGYQDFERTLESDHLFFLFISLTKSDVDRINVDDKEKLLKWLHSPEVDREKIAKLIRTHEEFLAGHWKPASQGGRLRLS